MTEQTTPFQNQTLLEHLTELRKRLTVVVIALVIGTIISFIFTETLLQFLIAPYGEAVQAIRPTEPIESYFKVALVSGAIIAMPVILFEVWQFIKPGLADNETRFVYIFIPAAFFMFLSGIAFSWFVLLPAAVSFLSGFLPDVFMTEWTASEYISFTTSFMFWIGVSFEMPLVIYLLARVGLVGPQTLREQWRIAIIAIAILAAAITPSVDPVTMLLTMAPLTVLYGLSIVLAKLGERQFERSMAID